MASSKHIMRQRQLAKRMELNARRVDTPDTSHVQSDSDWLAQNYPPVPESLRPRLSLADLNDRENYRSFQDMLDEDDITVIPDPLGRTGSHEPKSIYSPTAPSKYRVDRGNIRKYAPYVPPIY